MCEFDADIRAEMAKLEQDLRRAGKLAERAPDHPSLAAWLPLIVAESKQLAAKLEARRLAANDDADRAWVEFSETQR
ncbi:MAG TPA: hypothetical protein VM345_01810 [Acidimicrobiales bacterium]|nr:hypothetical protein [Acidimicrobiales bacterium]